MLIIIFGLHGHILSLNKSTYLENALYNSLIPPTLYVIRPYECISNQDGPQSTDEFCKKIDAFNFRQYLRDSVMTVIFEINL